MTAPLPLDATTQTVKVVLSNCLVSKTTPDNTLEVPLDRFTIYRSGYLTSAVIDEMRDLDDDDDDSDVTVFAYLPIALNAADTERLMQLVGLSPLPGAEPTLAEVVRLWPALKMLEARYAVDRCYTALAGAVSLDRAETILAVYLFAAMCTETSVYRRLGRDNVIASLMPMGGRDLSDADRSTIEYMTLRDRLVKLGMSIEAESLLSSTTATALAEGERDLHGAMVALVAENRPRVQRAVAEALRDWSLPLHAIDQVFATDFSIARPLTDAGARWLMAGESTAGSISFQESIREVCPAFADTLLGPMGPAFGDAIMAGGAVVNAMQKPDARHWLPGSDIDLWIVGVDHAARVKAFERTVRALFAAVDGCRATVTGSVVTVYAPATAAGKASAPVQVILTPYHSASQVVCGFDMSYSCAYYDGTDVYATWSCVCADVTRVARMLPGMKAKSGRVIKAQAKGFVYAGPQACPDAKPKASTDAAPAAPLAPCTAGTQSASPVCPTTSASSAVASETQFYYTPRAVIDAYCFRPLSNDDYTTTDSDGDDKPAKHKYGTVALSKRFPIAVPLMAIGWRSPKSVFTGLGSESIGFRLLDAKDAGSGISCHRADAMHDYHEAEKNTAAAALDNVSQLMQSSLSPLQCATAVAKIQEFAQRPGGFARDGFEFVTVYESDFGRVIDGITGVPVRIKDIDASRHVFSGMMTIGMGVFGTSKERVYCSKRMERLRVYPRAFVSTAARVMASAAVIAADRFTECAPDSGSEVAPSRQ